MKLKLYIIGMPGTGKTHFGRTLAQSMKMQFFDLDEMIEKREGCTIRKLVQDKGEQYFRETEHDVLLSTLNYNNCVIACGGGTPLHYNNMEWMKLRGIVVWLNTDLRIIAVRIANNITRRPMFLGLNDAELYQKLRDLYEKRRKVYVKADVYIEQNSAGGISLSSVIQRIMKFTRSFRT